jgi:hypothetical protein
MTYVWVIALYSAIGPSVGLFSTLDGKPVVYPNQAICRNALVANHLADINLLGQHGKCQLRQAVGGKLLHSRG